MGPPPEGDDVPHSGHPESAQHGQLQHHGQPGGQRKSLEVPKPHRDIEAPSREHSKNSELSGVGSRSVSHTSRRSSRLSVRSFKEISEIIVPKVDPLTCTVMSSGAMIACCAGMTNAVAFRALGAFVSHVTGSFTRTGLHLEASAGSDARDSFLLVLAFSLGSVLCGCLITRNTVSFGYALYGLALIGNAALLFLAILSSEHAIAPYLLAAACGLQNGMATSYSGAVIRTTHVTGLCTDIGLIIGRNSLAFFRRHCLQEKDANRAGDHTADCRKLLLLFLLGTSFLSGIIIGAALHAVAGIEALLLPACITLSAGTTYTFYRTVWLHQPLMKSTEASVEAEPSLVSLEPQVLFFRPSVNVSMESGNFFNQDEVTRPGSSSRPGSSQAGDPASRGGLPNTPRSGQLVVSPCESLHSINDVDPWQSPSSKSPQHLPRNSSHPSECHSMERLLAMVDAIEPSLSKVLESRPVPGQPDLQAEAFEAHRRLRSVLNELITCPDLVVDSKV